MNESAQNNDLNKQNAARGDYRVVKNGEVIWTGGCRNCAEMVRDGSKRKEPEASVYIK